MAGEAEGSKNIKVLQGYWDSGTGLRSIKAFSRG